MGIGLVIVSHSEKIADGIVDLAGQMAPDVAIVAAGGTDDSGLGTSFDKISTAILAADTGDGVVVLCDLGSAILTAETALDFLDDDVRARVRIADAPLVEGAVAAAVSAQTGGDLDGVVAAARTAYASGETDAAASATAQDQPAEWAIASPERATGSVKLVNPSGLHARPAAEFVRLAGEFDAKISVNGVDAKSLLRIMSLGLGIGKSVDIEATGPEAAAAVDALSNLVRSGFGE
jgi:PTS hybrid protein